MQALWWNLLNALPPGKPRFTPCSKAENSFNPKELSLKISARNKFEGTISAVNAGPVNAEVVLDLAGGDKLVAVITAGSAKSLGLAAGKRAVGLVKAPAVTVLTDADNSVVSG